LSGNTNIISNTNLKLINPDERALKKSMENKTDERATLDN